MASKLEAMCKENDVTLSNVFQTVWALVLRNYTASDNICFGYLSTGRDIPVGGIEEAIGLYANMLVYRLDISKTSSLMQLIKKAKVDFVNSLPHQHFSL